MSVILKKYSFCLLGIIGILCCCASCAAQLVEDLSKTRVRTVLVPCYEYGGFAASIHITNYNSARGEINGFIKILNNEQQTNIFRYYCEMAFQLTLKDDSGKLLTAGQFGSVSIKHIPEICQMTLHSLEEKSYPFRISLPTYYDVVPHQKYTMAFILDGRLFNEGVENPKVKYLTWSKSQITIEYSGPRGSPEYVPK